MESFLIPGGGGDDVWIGDKVGLDEGDGFRVGVCVGVTVEVGVLEGVLLGVGVMIVVGVGVAVGIGVVSGWGGIALATRKNTAKASSRSANNHPANETVSRCPLLVPFLFFTDAPLPDNEVGYIRGEKEQH